MDTMSEEIFADMQQLIESRAQELNKRFPELGPKGESESELLSWELREVATDFSLLLGRLNKIEEKVSN